MAFLDNAGVSYLWSKIKAALKGKQDTLTFDNTPTAGSSNPVTSDGIKMAIDAVVADGVYFTSTYDEATDTTFFNGTLEELQAAFDSGKKVYIDGLEVEYTGSLSEGEELTGIEVSAQDGLSLMGAKITADSVFTVLSVDFLLHTGNLVTEISEESSDEEVPSAKSVYDAVNAVDKTYIVEAVVSLSTSGLSMSLPSDVTYADIDSAVNNGLHVVMVAEFPSEAGTDFAGRYVIPFTKKMGTNGYMYFSTTVRNIVLWGQLDASGNLTFGYYYIEQQSNKVTSLSSSSTDNQYPTAKTVFDFVNMSKQVISYKGNADSETWYFPLGKMEIDNSGNYGNYTFTGRLGGWTNANTAVYSIMLMNRGNYDGNSITATVSASGQVDAALALTDIVVAKNDDLSHTVYLKCTGYFCYDFAYTKYQHSITYDGSYSTTAPSNIIWTLSGAPKTILSADGSFSASGGINANKVNGLTFKVSDTAPTVDDRSVITFVLEG